MAYFTMLDESDTVMTENRGRFIQMHVCGITLTANTIVELFARIGRVKSCREFSIVVSQLCIVV
jgi:hypothetical protein